MRVYYNICHWTDKDLSYDHLASGLKLALEKDKTALDADRLKNYTGSFFPHLQLVLALNFLAFALSDISCLSVEVLFHCLGCGSI